MNNADQMSDDEILAQFKPGTANTGGFKKKYFKVKAGPEGRKASMSFRILPAMGPMATRNKIYEYWSVCWGYKVASNSDPTKFFNKPFASCQRMAKRDGQFVVTERCPAAEHANSLKDKLAAAEEAYRKAEAALTSMVNPDTNTRQKLERLVQIKATEIEELKKLKMRFNIDRGYYYNVINQDGEFGVLTLGKRQNDLLMALMAEQKAVGVDITSKDDGRWVTFTRRGQGLTTSDAIEITTVPLDNTGAVVPKKSSLSIDDLRRALNECQDLSSLYPRFTAARIQEIVDNRDNPERLAVIFGAAENSPSVRNESLSARHAPAAVQNMGVADDLPWDEDPKSPTKVVPAPAKAAKAPQPEDDHLATLAELGLLD